MSYSPRNSPQVPKTMSSRLLTMKFMQRAAASSTTSLQTPPSDPQTPPAKRQKITTPSSAPASLSDLEAVRNALKIEEDRRAEALDRVAAVAGETKWVLSCADDEEAQRKSARSLRVLMTGYSDIDRGDVEFGAERRQEGRRRFGKFQDELENNEDEFDTTDSEDPADANERIRDSRNIAIQDSKSNYNAESRIREAEAPRIRNFSKTGEVNLNTLSSISGGGGVKSNRSNPGANRNAGERQFVNRQSNGKRKFE